MTLGLFARDIHPNPSISVSCCLGVWALEHREAQSIDNIWIFVLVGVAGVLRGAQRMEIQHCQQTFVWPGPSIAITLSGSNGAVFGPSTGTSENIGSDESVGFRTQLRFLRSKGVVGTNDSVLWPRGHVAHTLGSGLVQLGETRVERFHFSVLGDENSIIHPWVDRGSMMTRVVGTGVGWALSARCSVSRQRGNHGQSWRWSRNMD